MARARSFVGGTEDKANIAAPWIAEIEKYERAFERYTSRCEKILKRYRDEDRSGNGDRLPRLNILWSNIQTTGPALYAKTPKPEVERRFKDSDPIGRVAAETLQRCTTYSLDMYDFDHTMRSVRDDFQLVGRGAAWVEYSEDPYQQVTCKYLYWKDFLYQPQRSWNDVRWVARKKYFSKKEIKVEFPAFANQIPLDAYDLKDESRPYNQENNVMPQSACIYELWDKTTKKVYYISKGVDKVLRIVEDPLGLKGFFPTPRPLFATLTSDSLEPIPDYIQYQDLAIELDEVTMRISLLTDALRVCGVYDASFHELSRLLKSRRENELIPVNNWAMFAQQNGFNGVVQYFPINDVVQALVRLYDVRQQLKSDLYEITGIADIIRGNTAPSETATAQQLKGQFAVLRLSDKQKEVQRYARDLIAIKAEIIAELFSPEMIAEMAGVQLQNIEVQQLFLQAVQLLRNDVLRSFRISIETDSTLAIDESIDKQRRVEFMQAFSQFLGMASKAAETAPMLVPVMGEALTFLVRGFNAGRQLEHSIETTVQMMKDDLQQKMQAPPPPNPEMIKMQMDQQVTQAEMELKQAELQLKQQQFEFENILRNKDFELKQYQLQLDAAKSEREHSLQKELSTAQTLLEAERIHNDMQMKQLELVSNEIVQTKKAILDRPNLKIMPDGTIMPSVVEGKKIKRGKFSFDPISGERYFEVTEEPLVEEPEMKEGKTLKRGRITKDEEGNQQVEMITEDQD